MPLPLRPLLSAVEHAGRYVTVYGYILHAVSACQLSCYPADFYLILPAPLICE